MKETANWKPAYYATFYPLLRDVAIEHGYALAIHGSMLKDFDLLAVPWTRDACSGRELIEALAKACGQDAQLLKDDAEEKPHGRLAFSLLLGAGAYIDLSVMPRNCIL